MSRGNHHAVGEDGEERRCDDGDEHDGREEVRTFFRWETCRKVALEELLDGNAKAVGCRRAEAEAGCDVYEREGKGGEQ